MYSIKEVNEIIANWDKFGFWKSRQLEALQAKLSKEEFAKLCQEQFNGTGPDSFSSPSRKFLSWIMRLRENVAMHDIDYYLSTGKLSDWLLADERFYQNGKIEIRAKWKIYNPYRYLMYIKLQIAYRLLYKAGSSAYKAAYEKYNGSNEN